MFPPTEEQSPWYTSTAQEIANPSAISLGSVHQDGVATVHVLRLRGSDGHKVECVDGLDPPLPRTSKWIVNVSTQFGCPVGCPYCDAGGSFAGNLEADEILAQVRYVVSRHPATVSSCSKLKVHFSRMGDPALNDATLGALRRLPEMMAAPGLWACVATVAPRGRDGWFEQLLQVKQRHYPRRFQLQFSLNTTDPRVRQQLVPCATWSFDRIARYGSLFFEPGDRKVLLNFALAAGIPFDPAALDRLFDPALFAVKLTPLNPTERGKRAGMATLLRSERAHHLDPAVATLRERGFDVIISVGDPREDEVGSNCGQAVRLLAEGGGAEVTPQ